MSNKSKNHNKKWLISRLKTSGSKKRYVPSEDYADARNSKRNKNWDNLPKQEGMGKSTQFFNSRINYGPLVRFLRANVGKDWSVLYDEIMQRIPTNLSEYKQCVDWFVAQEVEETEDGLWDKGSQKFILLDRDNMKFDYYKYNFKDFYVDPETNTLCRIKDPASSSRTKNLCPEVLREFREEEQRQELEKKRKKRAESEDNKLAAKELFSRHNQEKPN